MLKHKRQFFWVLAIAGLLLSSGCATTSQQQSEPVVEQQEQSEPTVQPEPEVELPKVDLTKDLLKQILVSGFASYSGDWDKAAENAYQAAVSSRDYRYARYAAVVALRNSNFVLAKQASSLWVELYDKDEEAHAALLLSLLNLGETDQAFGLFKKHQAEQATKPFDEFIKDVAAILVQQNNAEAGISIAKRYVDENPNSAQAALSGAYVVEHFGKAEMAEQWLSKAMQLKPGWDLVAQLKAQILRKQGKLEERAQYIADYVAQNPKSVTMRISHAAVLAEKEKFEGALEVMKGVIKDDPENISALVYSAALAAHLKQDDLAKKIYKSVVGYKTDHDEARWALARYAVLDEKYALAEKHYSKINSDRSFFDAQLQIANMRYKQFGLESAMQVLDNLQPQTHQQYVSLANEKQFLLMQEFQYEEALAAINETLTYLPNDLGLRYTRALVAAELGEIELVEADLRFVIDREPKNGNALNALGYTLADQTERYDEAKELIEKALGLLPDQAHVLDSMGWVLYRLNDYQQSLDYLQRAFEMMPEPEVAAHLGEVLWESGDPSAAKKIWQSMKDSGKTHPALTKTIKRYID